MAHVVARPGALAIDTPTPMLADAVVRLGLPVRAAPAGISGPPGVAVTGRVLPVRHYGSVDVFLEALGHATRGDVMVVDNAGRRDEACIGDLIVREAMAAGIAGIIVWGLHRDAVEVAAVGLPVFSYGTLPFGPTELRPPSVDRFAFASFGDVTVHRSDVVAADPNGVLFLEDRQRDRVVGMAETIRETEVAQVALLDAGTSLREQFGFDAYLRDRERDPRRTFRQHLRERADAIEE